MSILVDTSVWSLGLRRLRRDLNPQERKIVYSCRDLLVAGECSLIGPIIQETLSGISDLSIFENVRERLYLVEELPLFKDSFIRAAEFYNLCRAAGVAPGAIDMMICTAAHEHATEIFTIDPDFTLYARHLPIQLFKF